MLAAALAVFSPTPALAHDHADLDALLALPMERLMGMEVTSVSKRPEPVGQAAAAIHVITAEDIRRSGLTSVPELLRLAPGVQVARMDSNKWAITARGFNSQFAKNLLVLIDGRSVFSPSFGGVFWDEQSIPVEDIHRIEVIRGPGATLWGANAVNGVINIITRSAHETQGGLLSTRLGTRNQHGTYVRQGVKNNDTALRVYAEYRQEQEAKRVGGGDNNDRADQGRAGFRTDGGNAASGTLWTMQGEAYKGRAQQDYVLPTLAAPYALRGEDTNTMHGGHLLGRVEHVLPDNSLVTVQAYLDRAVRDYIISGLRTTTADVELKHTITALRRHEIVWGVGYRHIRDSMDGTQYLYFDPARATDDIFSAFLQDRITLLPERLHLTLGTKLEYNGFTGVELQPSARLAWTPDAQQTVWMSVSRAVTTPNRSVETNVALVSVPPQAPGLPPAVVGWAMERDREAEQLTAFEAGYRAEITRAFTVDLAAFYNRYPKLTFPAVTPPQLALAPTPYIRLTEVWGNNNARGDTYGGEIAASWQVRSNWRLNASYSLLFMDVSFRNPADFSRLDNNLGASPRHQATLHSAWDITPAWSLDGYLFAVDRLRQYGLDIPGYVRADASLRWRASDTVTLRLTGQNLLNDRHQEFGPSVFTEPAEWGRTVYGGLEWRF